MSLGKDFKKVVLNCIFLIEIFCSINLFKKKFSFDNIFIDFIAEKLSAINCIFFFLFSNVIKAHSDNLFFINKKYKN